MQKLYLIATIIVKVTDQSLYTNFCRQVAIIINIQCYYKKHSHGKIGINIASGVIFNPIFIFSFIFSVDYYSAI